jgi:hypothetical protein
MWPGTMGLTGEICPSDTGASLLHGRMDMIFQRILNQGQAEALLHHIRHLTDKGLPPTHDMLRNFAHEISGVEPGKCWLYQFVKCF